MVDRANRRSVRTRPTVFVLDWLGHGGISRYAVDVANRLVVDYDVVLAGPSEGPVSGCRARIATWFPRFSRGALGDGVAAVAGILNAGLRPRRGDVVWLPLGLRPAYELTLAIVLRLRGTRVIGTVHNRDPSHRANAGATILVAVRVLHIVIAHTDELAAWLASLGVRWLRLPFPPPQPPDIPGSPLTRQDLGIPDDAVVVAMVGRLAEYKRLDVLVKAFALALDGGHAGLHLLIAGEAAEGVDPEQLVVQAGVPRERVTIIPRYLSDHELISVLDTIDALVLAYEHIDNSGIGSLAAYRGTPAIVTDLPYLQRLFGDRARVFPAGDRGGLAAVLRSTPRRSDGARWHAEDLAARDHSEYAAAVRRATGRDRVRAKRRGPRP